LEFDCFAIAGYFNIHIDNAETNIAKEIQTVLKRLIWLNVHGPTHNVDTL